jgi:hypothetical protein
MVAAGETTLQELLDGSNQYQVSLYQRTDSWQKEQLTRPWEDILQLAVDRIAEPGATHFIGSLVLAPSPANGPARVMEFLVVDEQQRLATLSLLLCAIRDHRAQTEDPTDRERINEQYLINRWRPEQHRLKLLPTQADPGFDNSDLATVCLSILDSSSGAPALGVLLANLPGGFMLPSSADRLQPVSLAKKRQRDHGEVFTPPWLVEAMLNLIKNETERIDSRFLESACGSGNFLVSVLRRKLAAVELKYEKSDFEKRHYALYGLMCIYGIELLPDNVAECRDNLLGVFANYLDLDDSDDLYRAASYVLTQNVVNGDAITMLTSERQPITFAEWGYLGKGRFQRRDFRFESLTKSAAFGGEGTLFAHLGTHEIFTPTKSYSSMTVRELAA